MSNNKSKQALVIKEKSVYGRVLLYPGCEQSELFARLLNVKTFVERDLSIIEQLGYTINRIEIPK